MIGNHSLSDCRRVLTPRGIFVVVGNTDKGRWLGPLRGMLKVVVASRFATQEMGPLMADMNQEDLTILHDLMQAGKVRSVIDRRYPLSAVPEAIRYLEEGHARGKVVITLDGNDGESAAVRSQCAASTMDTMGPVLTALAFVAIVIGIPVVGALALHRRFPPRGPRKRPFRWGYCFSIQSLMGGVILGIIVGMLLESSILAVIACGTVYAGLAWFFAQRRHWAWITLTILSMNPIVWLINFIYLRRRWAEG